MTAPLILAAREQALQAAWLAWLSDVEMSWLPMED